MEQDTSGLDANGDVVKKDTMLERLSKRNKERQNYNDVKFEQRNKESVHNEGVDYFAQSFMERAQNIEQRIKDAGQQPILKKSSGDAVQPDLAKVFADITLDIQELQRYLTSSTMFLSDYKIKSCQNMLNELTSQADESRQKLLPKKKFGFSGKKIAVKQTKVEPNMSDKLDAPEKLNEIAPNCFSWTIANRTDAYIRLSGLEVNGKDITISNLNNCFVELQGHAGSVQITKCKDCTFLCGPVARSLFAEYCERSTIAIACQQLRLHSSTLIRIYMHVTCRAIIEDCRQIDIAEYNYDYDNIEADFKSSGLDKSQNNYTDVADFDWLSPDVHSPNWTLLKDHAAPNWNELRRKFNDKTPDNSML